MKENLEKILKEFDEKFPRMFAGSSGQYNKNGDERPYYNDNVKKFIKKAYQTGKTESQENYFNLGKDVMRKKILKALRIKNDES